MKRKRSFRRIFLVIFVTFAVLVNARKIPEASSTLLKMHRLYMQQPPHDDSLYKTLGVSPNATTAEITKSFRKLSRTYHPDKKHHSSSSLYTEEERQEKLHQIRQAYEVLKDDTTRLPYHRFGLLDGIGMAAYVLTGGRHGQHANMTPQQEKLLHWMGYNTNAKTTHTQRVFFIAANLIEKLRPLVEGAIDEAILANVVAQECDELKKVPLGAQIIRCIGRAYRHAGQEVLRKHHREASSSSLLRPLHVGAAELSNVMRAKMRNAKQVLTAAVASGRLVVTEKMTQRMQKSDKTLLPAIDYHTNDNAFACIDQLIGEDDVHDLDSHLESVEAIKEKERLKAQTALLESLQVEALWKITKINLDQTIQEACNLILTGDYFFFPSHQSAQSSDWSQSADGWVGSTGEVVEASVGRIRAAAALVMVGDIMVQCSKEGTGWME